jgi:spore maturation protein CgeB
MLSQLAATVGFFRSLGIRAEVSHLTFEPAILDALPPAPTEAVDISFVGTVSADHQQRVALLEAIARRYELKLFGSARRSRLLSAAPLLSRRGLGRGHVSALRRSLITLNSHIDMVGREAGNARLFEATGVGTFCSPISRITCKRCSSQTARWWPGVQSTSASQ